MMIPYLRPLAFVAAFITAACTHGAAPTQPAAASLALDNGVYVADGICFGEWGCDYAHWRTISAITLHARPDPASPVVASVAPGVWVTPLEGQLRLQPIRGGVRTPFESQNVRLTPGEVVYMLEPQGEGYYTYWAHGQRFGSEWTDDEPGAPIVWDDPRAPLPAGAVTGQWRRYQLENGQIGWGEGGTFACMSGRSGDADCRG